MKKLLVEFIGTFFLTVTVGVTAVLAPAPFAPFAIGAVLMVMIYAGGHISGGHYNPAVSLAVFIRGRIPAGEFISYVLVQLFAALVAVYVAKFLVPVPAVPIEPLPLKIIPTLISEFLFTFALAWVVLNTATAKATSGNSNYGLAIGFTVLAGAITVGNISGGAFNPAVSTLLIALDKVSRYQAYLHFLPQIVGAGVAALAFRATLPEDR